MPHFVMGFSLLRATGERWKLTVYLTSGQVALCEEGQDRNHLWERGIETIEALERWENAGRMIEGPRPVIN